MKYNFKKILVAGGDGFLGKHVINNLKQNGINFVSHSLEDGFDFRNFDQTKNLFFKEKFDAVINCSAFVGGIKFGYDRAGEIFFNNILMATHLMECARLAGVRLFVNPISNCTYPAHLRKFKEEDWWSGSLHESVLAYGFARKASQVQSWAYNRQYGFNSINLILSNMYGPADYFDEVRSHALTAMVMKFVEAKRKKIPQVVVWGTGKPIREWLYVEDGAEALVRSLQIGPQIDPVNIGRGEGISISQLAKMIKIMTKYKGEIFFDKSMPDGAQCKILDVSRMKKIFNWTPPTALKDGIKKTIEWYEKNI